MVVNRISSYFLAFLSFCSAIFFFVMGLLLFSLKKGSFFSDYLAEIFLFYPERLYFVGGLFVIIATLFVLAIYFAYPKKYLKLSFGRKKDSKMFVDSAIIKKYIETILKDLFKENSDALDLSTKNCEPLLNVQIDKSNQINISLYTKSKYFDFLNEKTPVISEEIKKLFNEKLGYSQKFSFLIIRK